MKKFSIISSVMCLFVLIQSRFVCADIFTTTNKNIRINVVDYRDFLDDILFWLPHKKNTPVVAQKLINEGIYPISVTIQNDSNKQIKIIKNAIGGISMAQNQEVAQLYQYDVFARAFKKASIGAIIALAGITGLSIFSNDGNVEQSQGKKFTWKKKAKKFVYGSSSVGALIAGILHWSETATTNSLIKQMFQSHVLPEESVVDVGCSMTFLLFATHTPSGYTLKVPIFDVQDNQITSFSCSFGAVTAA